MLPKYILDSRGPKIYFPPETSSSNQQNRCTISTSQSQVLEQLLARSKQKNCPLQPGLWQETFGFRAWTRGREKTRATKVLPCPWPSYSHVQAVALGPTTV